MPQAAPNEGVEKPNSERVVQLQAKFFQTE